MTVSQRPSLTGEFDIRTYGEAMPCSEMPQSSPPSAARSGSGDALNGETRHDRSGDAVDNHELVVDHECEALPGGIECSGGRHRHDHDRFVADVITEHAVVIEHEPFSIAERDRTPAAAALIVPLVLDDLAGGEVERVFDLVGV